MLARLRSIWRDIQGSALVEATALTPVLFALVFGVMEFSWYFYDQHRVSTGVRDAARYLSRVLDPTAATLQTAAKNLAVTGDISGATMTPRVTGWTTGSVHVNVASIPNPVLQDGSQLYRGGANIEIVTVSTTFTYPSLGFLGLLGLTAPGISMAHSERVIGPG
jgi:Flp pilus assembly protein TadG